MSTKNRYRNEAMTRELGPYWRMIQEEDLLDAEEEVTLATAVAEGDEAARERMIRANLRLVVRIAQDYLGRGLSIEDLIGEGNLGLIRATQEFDPTFGTRFSTYAGYWVKQSIRQALLGTASLIRLPAHVVGLLTRWCRKERELRKLWDRPPTPMEIASALELSPMQQLMVGRALDSQSWSRDRGVGDESPWLEEIVVGAENAPEEDLGHREDLGRLQQFLAYLHPIEQSVLILRYGLGEQEPLTLKDVAHRLDMTREWARKLELRALEKMQRYFRRERTKPLNLPEISERMSTRSPEPPRHNARFQPSHNAPVPAPASVPVQVQVQVQVRAGAAAGSSHWSGANRPESAPVRVVSQAQAQSPERVWPSTVWTHAQPQTHAHSRTESEMITPVLS